MNQLIEICITSGLSHHFLMSKPKKRVVITDPKIFEALHAQACILRPPGNRYRVARLEVPPNYMPPHRDGSTVPVAPSVVPPGPSIQRAGGEVSTTAADRAPSSSGFLEEDGAGSWFFGPIEDQHDDFWANEVFGPIAGPEGDFFNV